MIRKIALGILFAIFTLVLLVFALFYRTDLGRVDLGEYLSAESEFVVLPGGINAHYRDEGNPEGPPIVLIHGGLGSLHNWEPWIDTLSQRYRIISADLPAHGLTGRAPEDIYTRDTMVEFINDLINELGAERFSLAGHSMGGGIAIAYALKYPDKVETLLLIGSEGIPNTDDGYDDGGIFVSDSTTQPGDSSSVADVRLGLLERYMLNFVSPWVAGQTLKLIVGNEEMITPELARSFARILRHEGNRYGIALLFKQFLADIDDPRDLEPRLDELSMPTMLLFGMEDPLVPPNIAERFGELITGSEIEIYEGVGHLLMQELPEQSVQDYLDFLDEQGVDG